MNRFIKKYGNTITAFAFMITTMSANYSCWFIFHQPELPKSARKLRKF